MARQILVESDPKTPFSTRLDPELRREIAMLAIETQRPLCSVVEEALTSHVARYREREGVAAA